MMELPIEPLATKNPRPTSRPNSRPNSRPSSTVDLVPRSSSRVRPRTQGHERQFSNGSQPLSSTPPTTVTRSRTIQVPVRVTSQQLPHKHASAYRDSYYTSEDEADEIRPRPLSVRQRSFTTSSASNSSSSIVIDGALVAPGEREKRYTTLKEGIVSVAGDGRPPIPRRAMTEGRMMNEGRMVTEGRIMIPSLSPVSPTSNPTSHPTTNPIVNLVPSTPYPED
ncbi:hypothetical protein ABW20_dc0101551 [Dactylellina cionopaga]|nr:hypothetical protein ABW20_dc0101551 [Dactylellina cionopaga]